jgi:hypothetical protein
MHNLISFNQLTASRHNKPTPEKFVDQYELMDSYFECLTECDESAQSCKRICKTLFAT